MLKAIAKLFGKRSSEYGAGEPIAEDRQKENADLAASSAPMLGPLSHTMPSYEWRYVYDDGLLGISGVANLAQANGIMNEVFGALRLDLALAKRVLGDNSPQLIDMLTNLANAAGSEGAERASDEYTDHAITLAEEAGDKSKISNALMRRAELRMDLGRMDEAQALLDEALALRRKALGENHPHVTALSDFAEQLRSGGIATRDKGPIRNTFEDLIESAKATIPSGRIGMAETTAYEALNLAAGDLGGFSAEALEALSFLGTMLLNAGRPNAALPHLLHACDVAYIREGTNNSITETLFAQIRQAIEDAPHGDHDLEDIANLIEITRSDTALYDWVIPQLNGGGSFGENWPGSRPAWNTIDITFVLSSLRDSGWLDTNPGADAINVSFVVAPDGTAHNITVIKHGGNEELNELLRERVANLRFALRNSSTQHTQEVWVYPHSLDLPGPDAAQIELDCMVVEYNVDGPDLWIMPCPQADDWLAQENKRKDMQFGDESSEHASVLVPPKLLRGEILGSDYPNRAIREESEGTVLLAFAVNRSGRVEDARVLESSGHKDLDTAAVLAVTRRFRYEPAQDEKGNPCTFTMNQSIRWEL